MHPRFDRGKRVLRVIWLEINALPSDTLMFFAKRIMCPKSSDDRSKVWRIIFFFADARLEDHIRRGRELVMMALCLLPMLAQ